MDLPHVRIVAMWFADTANAVCLGDPEDGLAPCGDDPLSPRRWQVAECVAAGQPVLVAFVSNPPILPDERTPLVATLRRRVCPDADILLALHHEMGRVVADFGAVDDNPTRRCGAAAAAVEVRIHWGWDETDAIEVIGPNTRFVFETATR